MRYLLILACIVLGLYSESVHEKPYKFRRVGPHRPIIPRRKPQSQQKPCVKRDRPIIIAVIDTGYGVELSHANLDAKLCRYGHRDYTDQDRTTDRFHTEDPVPVDLHGHGTHISGIIDKYAKEANADYCLVILKYWTVRSNGNENSQATIKAIKWATSLKVDFINYSGGGLSTNKEEIEAVKKFLDQGGKFIAAAGNERSDLSVKHYYPAEDDPRIIVVGNGTDQEHKAPTSNYGTRVNRWENGTDVLSYDMYMTGTSQAAAIVTGKMVAELANSCK